MTRPAFLLAHLEIDHGRDRQRWLLLAWLGWMLAWAIFFGLKYNEGNITGDLVHQVTTALSHLGLYGKDYLYRDPATMGFYSPQQVWSIVVLYRLTGSVAWSLAVLQFVYSAICAVGAWLIARQLSRNVWTIAVMMAALLQFATSPLIVGSSWGLLRAVFPAYFPYNWLLARGLVLVFVSLVIARERKTETAQALILGLIFTVHAPTGLTLSLGAVPYFLWRLHRSQHLRGDVLKWGAAFVLGAAYFLWNYWRKAPESASLTPVEKAFLYDFWQYRFPDDYPAPLWKLVLRSSDTWGWLAHVPLVLITSVSLWAIVRKSGSGMLVATGLLLAYVFGLKGLPLSLLVLFVAYRNGRKPDPDHIDAMWRVVLITFGAFCVCTWGQWASDLYHAANKVPPFIVDNTRFLPFLFPFVVVALFLASQPGQRRVLVATGAFLLSVPLARPLFDSLYQGYATSHGIKWRAQFDFDPHFTLSEADNRGVLAFAAATPPNSLFLFLDSKLDGWYFRLRARRSISVNAIDLGIKYYSKKGELIADWRDYLSILDAYRRRDPRRLCGAMAKMDVDYVVFPIFPELTEKTCVAVVAQFEGGSVLRVENTTD